MLCFINDPEKTTAMPYSLQCFVSDNPPLPDFRNGRIRINSNGGKSANNATILSWERGNVVLPDGFIRKHIRECSVCGIHVRAVLVSLDK